MLIVRGLQQDPNKVSNNVSVVKQFVIVVEVVRNVTGTVTRVSAKRSSNWKLGTVRQYFGGMVMYLLVI